MSEVSLKVAMACEVRGHGAGQGARSPLVRPAAPPPPHIPILACSGHLAHPHPLQGCVGAVRRVAEKLPGVTGVDIDLAAQKVGRPRVCACESIGTPGSLCRYAPLPSMAITSAAPASHLASGYLAPCTRPFKSLWALLRWWSRAAAWIPQRSRRPWPRAARQPTSGSRLAARQASPAGLCAPVQLLAAFPNLLEGAAWCHASFLQPHNVFPFGCLQFSSSCDKRFKAKKSAREMSNRDKKGREQWAGQAGRMGLLLCKVEVLLYDGACRGAGRTGPKRNSHGAFK